MTQTERAVAVTARTYVRTLIHRGYLDRGACVICDAPKAQAHHEDYSRPRLIVWLCALHHARVHNGSISIKPEQMIELDRPVWPKRRTKCKRGHSLNDKNIYSSATGGRVHRRCRICTLESNRLGRARAALSQVQA